MMEGGETSFDIFDILLVLLPLGLCEHSQRTLRYPISHNDSLVCDHLCVCMCRSVSVCVCVCVCVINISESQGGGLPETKERLAQ
jgi:hypothetical protein